MKTVKLSEVYAQLKTIGRCLYNKYPEYGYKTQISEWIDLGDHKVRYVVNIKPRKDKTIKNISLSRFGEPVFFRRQGRR